MTAITHIEHMDQDRDYMNTKQLAHYIGICGRTVTNMRDRGKFPYIKLGDRIFFSKASIDAVMAKLEVTKK